MCPGTFLRRVRLLWQHLSHRMSAHPCGAFYDIGNGNFLYHKKTRLLNLRRRVAARVTTSLYPHLTIRTSTSAFTLSRYNRRNLSQPYLTMSGSVRCSGAMFHLFCLIPLNAYIVCRMFSVKQGRKCTLSITAVFITYDRHNITHSFHKCQALSAESICARKSFT